MSLLGFNFSFGARDDGFASALTRAGSGIQNVSAKFDGLAKQVSSGNFFNAMNTLQLDRIGDQLAGLKGQSTQLETSLEGTFRGMSAEIRPALAQMNLTQKEFSRANSQIVSTADALNVGAGEVASSFRAISRTGESTKKVLKSMGIGMKELTLIQKATGMESEQFTALVTNLTDSYGFNTEETKSFLNNFTNLSQGLGIADIAFGSLQETMGTLDETLSSNTQFMAMSREEQAKHVEEQVMGVQRLTKSFMTLGKTPQEAQASALQFFKTISQERKSINGMTIGIGDMGETFKSLAEEAGFQNVDKLFSNISSDPVQALQQIMEMQEELAKAGDPAKLARFNSKLQDMMGGLAFMKDAGKGFRDSLGKVNEATSKTGDGLVGMAKRAHTTNRGLDEVLTRMEDRFERNLMKLTGNTRTMFVRQQRDMYKVVGKEAKNLAGNETWGPLFKQFVSARKIGASAFFLPMQRDAKQTKKALAGIDEAVGQGGLLGRFKAIQSAGIAGFFMDLDGAFKSNADRLKDAEDKALKYYARLEAIGLTTETLKPALMALGTAFASLFVVTKVVSSLATLVSIGGSVAGVLTSIAGGIASAIGAIASAPAVIAVALAGLIYGIGEGIKFLANAPQEFFDGIADTIDNATIYLSDAFDAIMDIDVFMMVTTMLDKLEDWIFSVFKGLASFFSNPSKFMVVINAIGRFGIKLGMVAVAVLGKLGEVFVAIGLKAVSNLQRGFQFGMNLLDEYVGKPLRSLGRKISKAWNERIVEPVAKAGTYLYDAFTKPFEYISEWWAGFSLVDKFKENVWFPLARFIITIGKSIMIFFNDVLIKPFQGLINMLIKVFNSVNDLLPKSLQLARKEYVNFSLTDENMGDVLMGRVTSDYGKEPAGKDVKVAVDQTKVERLLADGIKINKEMLEEAKRSRGTPKGGTSPHNTGTTQVALRR